MFCTEENKAGTLRCVLGVNHDGQCSLQSKRSTTVRMILAKEEQEKKFKDS